MIIGILGNGLIFVIYNVAKKQPGRVYIMTLAGVDVLSCVLLPPMLPLVEAAGNGFEELDIFVTLHVAGSLTQGACYIFIQLTMALDQFLAAYLPFKYTDLRPKLHVVMITMASIASILGLVAFVSWILYDDSTMLMYCTFGVNVASNLILLTVYPAIAFKLYKQTLIVNPGTRGMELRTPQNHQNTAASASDNTQHSTTGSSAPNNTATKISLHRQALKIYSTIYLIFLSLATIVSIAITHQEKLWITYFYYINYIINVVVYYAMIPRFRSSINEYLGAMCERG